MSQLLQHVLVVDDERPEGVTHEGIVKVTQVNTAKKALEVLKGPEPVDLLILDWILDPPDTSEQAQGLLVDLMEIRFIPVLIWTNHPDQFKRECPSDFPEVSITCVEKLPYAELMDHAKQYFAGSFAGKLAEPWRTAVYSALEQSLYDLARARSSDVVGFLWKEENEDRPTNAVNQLLSHILHQDPTIQAALDNIELNGERLPGEDAITALQAVLTNRVTSADFREQLSAAVQVLRQAASVNGTTGLDALVHAEKYYQISDLDTRVRSGDIVEIDLGNGKLLGIVLTPGCDMRKTRFLRLVVVEPEDPAIAPGARKDCRQEKTYSMASLFSLQEGKHYAANFHDILSVHVPLAAEETHLWHKQRAFKRLTYDLTYQTRTGQSVTLKRLYRLDDPYRSDIIQRFASHASRIGIPELPYRDN